MSPCTICGDTPADALSVVTDDSGALELDLCETCRSDLLAEEWIELADRPEPAEA